MVNKSSGGLGVETLALTYVERDISHYVCVDLKQCCYKAVSRVFVVQSTLLQWVIESQRLASPGAINDK